MLIGSRDLNVDLFEETNILPTIDMITGFFKLKGGFLKRLVK